MIQVDKAQSLLVHRIFRIKCGGTALDFVRNLLTHCRTIILVIAQSGTVCGKSDLGLPRRSYPL